MCVYQLVERSWGDGQFVKPLEMIKENVEGLNMVQQHAAMW